MGSRGSSRKAYASNTLHGVALLIVLALASIIILTVYAREGQTGPVHTVRSIAKTVATPFDWIGSQTQRPFDALGRFFTNVTSEHDDVVELQNQNNELIQLLAELNEYKLENARLQQILSLTGAYGAQGIGARVLNPNQSEWRSSMTIDRGSTSGIKVDSPVLSGTGVLGQISVVSATTSEVRLLNDVDSKVSALLQTSRTTGVLGGSVDGSLHLEFVPTTTSIEIGEIVVTSGLGGVYPKGLPLGIVSNVSEGSSSLYYDITVTPVANLDNQEEVYVVTSYDATSAQQAADELLTTGSVAGIQLGTVQVDSVPIVTYDDTETSEPIDTRVREELDPSSLEIESNDDDVQSVVTVVDG